MKKTPLYTLALGISALSTISLFWACGELQFTESKDENKMAVVIKQGVFLDSAVAGISYLSGQQTGTTTTDGTFNYEDGKTVQFSVGGLVIGEGLAKDQVTPVDLAADASDASHQAVINISRFLQTLDNDGNPANGITITSAVTEAIQATGQTLDFNVAPELFAAHQSVKSVIAAVVPNTAATGGKPTLVSRDDAVAHLEETMTTAGLSRPGFAVSAISGNTTENGGAAAFTVSLRTQPASDVSTSVESSNTKEGTVSPARLVFTPANYNAKQTVTVTGINDTQKDGSQNYEIILGFASSNDANYNGLNPGTVKVTNIDDESAGFILSAISGNTTEDGGTATFTIKLQTQPDYPVMLNLVSSDPGEGTVSPAALTFTRENWNGEQTVTLTGVDDTKQDGHQAYQIQIAVNLKQTLDETYKSLSMVTVAVINTDDETPGFTISAISGNTTEAGGTAAFTVKLNTQPTADVSIGVSSSDTTEGTVSPASLIFTSVNWNANQTVTVTGVNDDAADGNQAYKIILAAASSSNSSYNGLNPDDVSVTNTDNDSPGFTIGTISGSTTESRGTAAFTVKLNSQPTADVTMLVSSSRAAEGTVTTSSLTFTSLNWNANQTVTVTGVDDFAADGNQSYSIVLGAVTSSDSGYNGLNPADVSVTNTDNDSPGFTISTISGSTTESGGIAVFTVKLNSQPTANVTMPVSSSRTAEGTVATASLTFTSVNWSANQTVTVTGVDDFVADGHQSYSIVLGAVTSSDSGYNGLNPDDVSLSNTDNDTAGFTISASSGTTEAGVTATFTVKLTSQPTADVTIPVSSSDTTEGTVSSSSLTFTTSNWSTNQTVTVTGVNDDLVDGNQSYTIILGIVTSSDSGYNGLNPSDVSVTNTDNDPPTVTAASVAFTDTDYTSSEVAGTVTISKASSESTLTHYVLYWGSSSTTKQSGTAITEIAANGSATYSYIFSANTALPSTATHLLVYTKNTYGESSNSVSVAITNLIALPDTGQTASYTTTFGEDHDYLINAPSYTDNGNGTITDNVTGVMWQKEDDNNTYTWSAAGTYCDGLSLGGYDDWRLPGKKELLSIANFGTYNPAINTTYFTNTNSTYYWSSTTDASSTSNAWDVYFGTGSVNIDSKTGGFYVRCVRGGQSEIWSLGYLVSSDTVLDQARGLMWQQQDDNTTRTWEAALSYCEGLSLGGYSDWRLPNARELESITSNTNFNPAISTTYFPNTKFDRYWSSTTDASYTPSAWYVRFDYGNSNRDSKTYSYYVRCVRGGQ